MHRKIAIPALIIGLFWATDGCRFRPNGGDTADSLPLDTQDSVGDTAPDTDVPEETGETGDTEDTAPDLEGWWQNGEFEVVSVNRQNWDHEDYVVLHYELADDASGHYDSLFDDEDASFYLMVPEEVDHSEELDILVWYHGGAIGADTDPHKMPSRCQKEKVMNNWRKAVEEELLPTAIARRNNWAVLVPRNDWCDCWFGQGPDDPIDPERHYGYYHVTRVLDFVLDGGVGFQPSGELYGWGTSMGGTAAILAAYRYAGFTSIVTDSPPSSMFLYHELNTFGEDDIIVEHLLGGPPYDDKGEPTEWYDNYADVSAETIIATGDMQVPLYVIWNSQDGLCDPPHVERLIDSMNSYYASDVRHGEHDVNHKAPGEYYHTQSTATAPPWGYSGSLLVDFLQGSWLNWTEAEDGCQDDFAAMCTVGESIDEDVVAGMADYSGGTVLQAEEAEGAGTMWCDTLPSDLPTGQPIRATAILVARSINAQETDPLVTMTYMEGEDQVQEQFTVEEFLGEDETDMDAIIAQYRNTVLEFTPTDLDAGAMCLTVHGAATVYFDSVVYGY